MSGIITARQLKQYQFGANYISFCRAVCSLYFKKNLVDFGQILSLLQGFENLAHEVEILCLWRPYVDRLYMWRERKRKRKWKRKRERKSSLENGNYIGNIGGYFLQIWPKNLCSLRESCVACRCWPQIAGIQQFVGSAAFASLYTLSRWCLLW